MKKRYFTLICILLCACTLLASCAKPINTVENFCFAVRDFDLEKAAGYTVSDAEGYFANASRFAADLSEEQTEIAKELFSHFSFSTFEETEDGCVFDMKYVDFAALIAAVEIRLAVGTGTASEFISEMLDSGEFATRFVKVEENVSVSVSEADGKSKIPLGYAGVNKRFTSLLGLDTFLRWYSLQR